MISLSNYPYDILCVISNFLNTQEVLVYRSISRQYNEIFKEYWLHNNEFNLYCATLISTPPEWFKNTNLVLDWCEIDRDVILNLPDGTLVKGGTSIYDPITDFYTTLMNRHLDNVEKYYNVKLNIRLCRCSEQVFCGKEYCSSLDKWLPEYHSIINKDLSIVPTIEQQEEYIDDLLNGDYEQMEVPFKFMSSFMCFFDEMRLGAGWLMFTMTTLYFRHVRVILSKIKFRDTFLEKIEDALDMISDNEYHQDKKRFISFLERGKEIVENWEE